MGSSGGAATGHGEEASLAGRNSCENQHQRNCIEDKDPAMFGNVIFQFLRGDTRQRDKYNGNKHHQAMLNRPVSQISILHRVRPKGNMRTNKVEYQGNQQLGVRYREQSKTQHIVSLPKRFLVDNSEQSINDYEYKKN